MNSHQRRKAIRAGTHARCACGKLARGWHPRCGECAAKRFVDRLWGIDWGYPRTIVLIDTDAGTITFGGQRER